MEQQIKHFLYTPFTGLGNFQGFRGNRWLVNRIKIFKQFVIPNLQAQTSHNFTLWCSWRPEEKHNKYVRELMSYLDNIKEFKAVHTFNGCCFYDDKYENDIARERLINNLHYTMGELLEAIGQTDYVLMTIQPSDDLYDLQTVEVLQKAFTEYPDIEGLGFSKGYICNYLTKEVREYNPTTNPPFYTIKFKKEDFIDPLRHIQFTGLKSDVGKYKKGTPLPSHEYVKDCINYDHLDGRGFLVGTHQDNISTAFSNPFAGEKVEQEILKEFGIDKVEVLTVTFSLGRFIFSKLSYQVKRKLRYWSGEKQWILRPFFAIIYNILRS
jgi:hypothetical protein